MAAAATAAAMRNKMNSAAAEEAQKEGERRAAQVTRHSNHISHPAVLPAHMHYTAAQ